MAQAPIVLTAADISNGSVTLPGIANPGEGQTLTVTAQVSNPAGIAGASGSDSAIIDTTPPAASVTLNANITPDDVINAAESKQDIAITGSVGGDVKAGDTVTLTVNGKTFTGTVAADKTFSIPVPGADLVADSDKTIDASVTTTDAAGNSTTATASEGYSVDTTAPTLTAQLDPASDSGTPGDGITNDNTPTISGTGEPGNTITVTTPVGETLTTTVKPDGTWSVTPTQPLPDGAANFPVTATDPAGNSTSSSVPVTIDTTPPAASVTLNANITPDDVINAAESKQDIAITGSVGGDAKAGDTVTLTVNGKTFTGTVAADKTFSIPVPGADLVADSDKTIDASVTTTDAAGNSSTATASEGYSVDTTAPTLTAQLDPASDSGTPGDGITNDNTPTISGTGEPGNTITVTTPVGETLTTTVKPDGTWSVTPTQPLPDGAANFPVTATDPAGNSTSSSVPVTIDTTLPAASVTLNANITPDDVINAAESKQDIAITGSVGGDAKAGDTVTLTVNGKTFTGTVAADKTFSIPVPGADLVADSDKTIDASVTTTDAAGNSSTATASEGYSVDTTAPTLTAQLDPASDSGTPGDGITNDNTPTISGTGEPGNTITVTTPVGETLTTTVKPDGTWSVTPTQPLPDGAANFPVTATDPAGNSTSSSVPVTIDTTAPALTAVLDPASDSGKAGDGITSDTTPTISGTGEPGNSIQVTMPGTGEVLTTTVGPDGKWSVTPTQALPEGGPQTVSVLETDPAGVTSTATVPVTIDTTAPTLTAVLDPASDSGKAGDGITSDTTPTISGTGEPGNSIQVTMPGTGEVLTTTVGLDGKWSVTPTQALPEGGPQTVSVLETDPAGVTSTATVPVTIDTTPPLITVSAPDNSNDSTPTITGTSNVPAGTVVTLVVTDSAGTVQTLSATVQAGGSYSVDVPVAMPDGNFTVSASVVDPAGNPASASDNGSLDALAGAITVQATVDNANRQLDISGSTVDVAPGQQVALKIQDQSGHVINTTAIVQPDGSYSLQDVDVSSLQDGTLTTTASAIDRNGATRVANDLDQLDVFNTAPVNTVPGAQSLLEDGSRVISGLAISDPDAGSGYLTVTLNVSNGVLNVLAGPAVISGSGTGSVVLSGTVAMINATLAAVGAVTYAPAANYNGSDSLTMTTLDNGNTGLGGPLSDTDTVAITVTSVNDAPNGADKTIQLSEGGIYTFKLSDFGFTDPNDTPANGFLNVTINTIPVNGTLFLDSDGDGMYSSGEELPAGQLVAASAINSGELKYYSALGNTVDDTFDFSVRDNGGTANGGKNTDPVPNRFTMDVVPLPVVTVNAPDNTNDSTPTLSGTSNQPAGSIVTITVTDSTGAVQTLSATVQTNGTYSVDVPSALAQGAYTAVASSTNVLGDSTTASDNGSVDSIPPVLTAKLDPSSDSGTVGDGVTNDNTPTISGTGEPGSTIQVTMPGTNEVLTTNVGPDGKWSVTPTQALPEGGPQTVAVKETDSAGNSTNATVPITVDTLPPPLVAKLDPASDSGVVGDGITNDNTPTISGSGTPGDIITVTMPTGEVLTTTVKPDGSWSVTPTQALPDGAISIPVTATDPAGNITSSSVPVTIDTTPPVPTITLNPNVTADDIINASEATQPVPVTGSVGGDAKAGDIVTLTVNGKTFTGTVQADKTFSINVPGSDLVADTGKTITASVTTTDDAGNPGSASSSDSYNVDTTAPNSSTTSITVDNVTADNVINAAEATQSIPVSGKVTGEFKAGDVVTLLVNGSSYQTTVDAAGNYSVNVAGSDLKADTSIDATVAAHDAAGNVGDVSTVHSHSVDTTPPVPTITLNPNLTADDIINASEATQPIPVTGSVGGDAKAGDIVTLTVNGKTFTGTVQADKTFSINVPGSDLVADTGKTITASVTTTDAAGNPGSASTSDSYSVDTTAPNSTTTSITVDNVTADNIINAAEAAQAIPVSGKVTGEFKVGDVVTLQVNGNNYQTTVDAAGNYSVNVAGSDLKADTTIDAKVAATDPAGNVGDVSTVHSHSVQINIAPTANPDNAVVVEAGGSSGSTNYYAGTPTATGNVLGNDTVTDTGGTKTLTVVNGQTISGSTAINGVYGTLTIAADGSYSYALDNTKTATNLLAKGAVVNEVFNYTMQDGKGLSSSSQLTVQVSGTNDAPTFTTLQPIEKLFPTVASSYGNLIDITPIDGTPKMGVAPTGWNITRNTPDLTLYNPDGVTKVQYADSTAYKVYGVKGSSLDGGAALGLFNVVSSGYTEGVHTVLYNLEAGKTYTIGFEWQKMITVRWQGLYNQYSYGGAFKITSSTGQTKTFTQSALSQDDAWQLASFTFVATGINEIFTIESVIVPAPGEVGTDSLQSVIVDSLNATNLQTLLATANSTGAKLSELMSDAVAIDSGDSIKGYAITSAAQTSAGYWEYNNGSSWVNLGALGASAQNAVFLTADTALRWNGASTSTALSMVAVDTTDTQFTGVGSVGDVSVNGGSTAYSAPVTLAATRYGTSQIDNLVGDDSNNQLLGLAGNDTLNGGLGDDYLDGGKGADTLIGGTGKDTFVWHFGDGGSPGTPVRDTINDFNRSEGDVLDLRDLLKNESASNLTQYLHFTASGSDTLVQVSSLGSFNGSNYATVVDQEILLKGVALSSLGSTDTAIINELLKNNLKVDGM
ncbi:VCBS repeat-containing protein [Vogesella perlucida]|nr:VCBS repeat-containing protein [Vogesella perlucida]